jgi:transcriptional regulator GlxA family with amidase domain
MHAPIDVAILAFPEATASVVYGFHDLFHSVGRDWGLVVDGVPGPVMMRPQVVASRAEPFTAANGVQLAPHAALGAADTPQVVCIPEITIPPGEWVEGRFDPELAWIERCHAAGATLATACSGAMLLAEAGLLDGHDATTHWAYCDVLQRRYPKVRVHRQRALVVTGEGQRLVMAGGGTSWLDLALYLIARHTSIDVAM